jgi:hypothetical protein
LLPIVVPSSSSTLLCTQPTSTTLFPVLSKLTGSILSFEDLMDNSMILESVTMKNFKCSPYIDHGILHQVRRRRKNEI